MIQENNQEYKAVVDDRYYQDGQSFENARERFIRASAAIWRLAALLLFIALIAAIIALWLLIPLKQTEVVVMEVDKTTGYLQVVRPLQNDDPLTGNEAVTISNIVRFIRARETYDPKGIKDNFDLASLLSTGKASTDLVKYFSPDNPNNPLKIYGADQSVSVNIWSVSFLNERTASVRFSTTNRMISGQTQTYHWVANVRFKYTSTPKRNSWMFDNPLGFQVFEYRRDQETIDPTVEKRPALAPAKEQVQSDTGQAPASTPPAPISGPISSQQQGATP